MGLFGSSVDEFKFDFLIEGEGARLFSDRALYAIGKHERTSLIKLFEKLSEVDGLRVELYEREGRKRII